MCISRVFFVHNANGPYYYYRSSGAFTVLAGAVNVRDRRRATLDNNNEYDNNDLI